MNLFRLSCWLGVVFSGFGLSTATVWAQEGWRLEKDKDQILVYSRRAPGSKSTELKVECTLAGTQSQLVALLSDIPNYRNVIYKTKSAQLIRRVSETELLYYVVSALPWPVSDRDMAVRLTFAHDPASKLLQVRGVGVPVPGAVATNSGTVRIADWLAVWQVQQVTKQQMRVIYTCRFDPGGDIPAWLDHVAAASSAYQSFVLIRKSLALPRYQGKVFAFLGP
ncbi:SRPBCC family protein [Spirosoma areae]